MATLRYCMAFNMDGRQCAELAGHEGKHAIVTEWDDSECWTPDHNVITPTVTLMAMPKVDAPQGSGKCLICEHPMHEGACGADDGDDFTCDCANGVEG